MTDDGTPTPQGEEEEETLEQFHSVLQHAITLKTAFMDSSLFKRKSKIYYRRVSGSTSKLLLCRKISG